jgi:hypothetical protein
MRWMALLLITLMGSSAVCPRAATAEEPAEATGAPDGSERTTPYVAVQVEFELQAINGVAREVATSVDELARSMAKLARSPSLSRAQRAELMNVFERVDQLSERVAGAVENLPTAIEQSREPLTGIATDLATDVRRTVMLVLGALLGVLVLALLAIYLFAIRPTARAAASLVNRLGSLTKSVEASIGLVGETNEVQLELAKILEAQRLAIQAYQEDGTEPNP